MMKKTALTIRECFPCDADVKPLLSSLSGELLRLTGNDGTASFSDDDMHVERSVFLVAVVNSEPVGCGGLRPITNEVCEIKRMYIQYRGQGIGSEILQDWKTTRRNSTTSKYVSKRGRSMKKRLSFISRMVIGNEVTMGSMLADMKQSALKKMSQ